MYYACETAGRAKDGPFVVHYEEPDKMSESERLERDWQAARGIFRHSSFRVSCMPGSEMARYNKYIGDREEITREHGGRYLDPVADLHSPELPYTYAKRLATSIMALACKHGCRRWRMKRARRGCRRRCGSYQGNRACWS